MMIHAAENATTIYLDERHSYPIVVSLELASSLKALVEAHRVCMLCAKAYEDALNPRVSENLCLACYERTFGHVYVGRIVQAKGPDTHLFKGTSGYIGTSSLSGNDAPWQDSALTLAHYHFPRPQAYEDNGEQILTDVQIFGNFRTARTVVVRLTERLGSVERQWMFLCNCVTGKSELLSKRDKRYQAAKKVYLATTDKYSRYEEGILDELAKQQASA